MGPYPYARLNDVECHRGTGVGRRTTLQPGPEAVVTTVTRALPLPARRTASLIAGVVLLVVLSFPLAAGASTGESADVPSSGGAAVSPENTADTGPSPTAQEAGEEVRPYIGSQTIALGPPASTCDQRSVLRDLPDAVPSCALRLAVWDQPWWPLPLPHLDPVPERIDAEGLPPTRAPPLTAHATV